MKQAIYAYPWDILDDPKAAGHIKSMGFNEVSLAASYHATRAWTPHNPRRAMVDARHAAVYWKTNSDLYETSGIVPEPPGWMESNDSFGKALRALREADLRVNAWVVVTHSTVLGRRHPDRVVMNAFGDLYTYALCPSNPNVRAYAAALLGELTGGYDLDGIELEACGYLGADHDSLHEKRGVHLDEFHLALLSLCFCETCVELITAQGGDADRVRELTVDRLREYFSSGVGPTGQLEGQLEAVLGRDAEPVLEARDLAVRSLMDSALSLIPPNNRPQVFFHAYPNRLVSGAMVGASSSTLIGRSDGVILALSELSPRRVTTAIQRARGLLDEQVPILAAFDVTESLGRTGVRFLDAQLLAAVSAQVTGLRYYHYGLASLRRLGEVESLVHRLSR